MFMIKDGLNTPMSEIRFKELLCTEYILCDLKLKSFKNSLVVKIP